MCMTLIKTTNNPPKQLPEDVTVYKAFRLRNGKLEFPYYGAEEPFSTNLESFIAKLGQKLIARPLFYSHESPYRPSVAPGSVVGFHAFEDATAAKRWARCHCRSTESEGVVVPVKANGVIQEGDHYVKADYFPARTFAEITIPENWKEVAIYV